MVCDIDAKSTICAGNLAYARRALPSIALSAICLMPVACVTTPEQDGEGGGVEAAEQQAEHGVRSSPADLHDPGPISSIPQQPSDVFIDPTRGNNRRTSEHPAVVTILDQSWQYEQAGKLDSAAQTVERGLRIAPQNPALWQRLAQIRLQQRYLSQAVDLARKSISLGQGRAQLIRENYLLIATAYELVGNKAGHRAAMTEAERYRQ